MPFRAQIQRSYNVKLTRMVFLKARERRRVKNTRVEENVTHSFGVHLKIREESLQVCMIGDSLAHADGG